MSHILIIYGTTEGHTAKIAEAIRAGVIKTGAEADVVMAGTADPRPNHYAGVIVAGSIHAGGYQKSLKKWVRTHVSELGSKPTALVTVCLAVLEKDPEVAAELDAIVTRFTRETGWHPATKKLVAGALLYTQYNFFKRWIMKRIAAKGGGDTDVSRDYDYTDWNDVMAFGEQFGRQITRADAPAVLAAAG
jgi:menaquinone-dependent protoporphyrinogen oxidase